MTENNNLNENHLHKVISEVFRENFNSLDSSVGLTTIMTVWKIEKPSFIPVHVIEKYSLDEPYWQWLYIECHFHNDVSARSERIGCRIVSATGLTDREYSLANLTNMYYYKYVAYHANNGNIVVKHLTVQ